MQKSRTWKSDLETSESYKNQKLEQNWLQSWCISDAKSEQVPALKKSRPLEKHLMIATLLQTLAFVIQNGDKGCFAWKDERRGLNYHWNTQSTPHQSC